MNAILINGSPRIKRGVHASMLDSLENGLIKAGSEVMRENVYELTIGPCTECSACWSRTPGVCSQKDDMESIIRQVADADLIVLATPVYIDGMTGPMKTFLDRLIPLLLGRVELRDGRMRHIVRDGVKHSSLLLMSASGFAELETFDPLVAHVKAASKNFGWNYMGEILLPSGWYIRRQENAWTKVSQNITSAGIDLVNTGQIPDLTDLILDSISKEKVIEQLNSVYGKYE